MNLLVLGGTAWLGREVAATALGRGHSVTCLARGESGEVATGARLVVADRDLPDAYSAVAGRRWDAVVDVARQPGHVRRAVAALEPAAQLFVFVSSGNVYASQREPGQDEQAELLPPLADDVMGSMDRYGEAKVACEQAVLEAFGPSRALVARAGLIGGPGDTSGRSGYWPWRFANPSGADGDVLVPADRDVPTALIDVRDAAAWLVTCAEERTTGVFNVAGEPVSLGEHLDTARDVAGHTGPVVAAPREWLLANDVNAWMGPMSLPLWLDDPDWYGISAHATRRARAAGLRTRSLRATLADTLAWEQSRPDPGPHGAGLTDAEERRLLARLGRSSRPGGARPGRQSAK